MKTILVVDDDRLMTRVLFDRLRHLGYSVKTAASAEAALFMDLSEVSLILCDYNMPGMDGTDLIAVLREVRHYERPFVFVTATDLNAELLQSMSRYRARLLEKPLAREELLAVLHELAPLHGEEAPMAAAG